MLLLLRHNSKQYLVPAVPLKIASIIQLLTTAAATVLLAFVTILQYAGEVTDTCDVYNMNQTIYHLCMV